MNIFAETAPAFWERGLPVIPIQPKDKRPITQGWQHYTDRLPDKGVREAWLQQYPEGNIGLVMGSQSGVVAMDIDTVDPKALEVIEAILPKSPWKRIGAKGCVYLYKYSGQRTFRIKDKSGATLVELLAKKVQIVIPPSIHPDTQKPYTENVPLLDVIDQVLVLHKDVELHLREALRSAGFELSQAGYSKQVDWTPAGSRDSKMASVAGIQARAVVKGDRTLKESINEMTAWVEDFTEKVCGDELSPAKGVDRLVQFLTRDVMGESNQSLPRGWDEGLTDTDKANLGLVFEEDHEDWDYEQCVKYLRGVFETHGKESLERQKAIEHVVQRISRNQGVSELEEERILKWIASTSSNGLTMSGLRKALKSYRMGAIEGLSHTEIAEEVLKDMTQFGTVKFSDGFLWQWTGANWDKVEPGDVLKIVAQNYGHLPAARKNSDHNGILSVLKNISQGDLKVSNEEGINFANGFLTIDGVLEEHREEHGMTYCLPYRYLPEAAGKSHRFNDFLDSCWGEDADCEAKKQALQEAICVTLFGSAWKYQRAFLLFGAARSGKSTVLNIITGLVPDGSWSAVPPQDWNDKFMPTTMVGKLLNYAGELSEDKFIDGASFKTIVEGGELSGQYKGQQIFRFSPRCAHWFAANFLPRTKDTSAGFTRRWLIFHFRKVVKACDAILGLSDILLSEEREEIVAWAVAARIGLKDKSELKLPDSHSLMAKKMAGANNSVRFFLTKSGKIKFDPQSSSSDRGGSSSPKPIPEVTVYHEYYSHLLSTGNAKLVPQNQFSMHMAELATEFGFQMHETEEATTYTGFTIAKK